LARRMFVGVAVLSSVITVMGISVYYYRLDLKFLLEPSWLTVLASLVLAFALVGNARVH